MCHMVASEECTDGIDEAMGIALSNEKTFLKRFLDKRFNGEHFLTTKNQYSQYFETESMRKWQVIPILGQDFLLYCAPRN